jgi:hypothetical protein
MKDRVLVVICIAAVLLSLAWWGAIITVAWHFVRKLW